MVCQSECLVGIQRNFDRPKLDDQVYKIHIFYLLHHNEY
jgi:hypothetical protein